MDPTRAEITYSRALNRNSDLFHSVDMHRAVAPEVLHPDEEVLAVLVGVAGDFPDLLVVTVRRLLKVKVGGLFRRVTIRREVTAPAVSGVEYSGRVFSLVKVNVHGQRPVRMMPNRKADAARFAEAINELVSTGRLPHGF